MHQNRTELTQVPIYYAGSHNEVLWHDLGPIVGNIVNNKNSKWNNIQSKNENIQTRSTHYNRFNF